MISPDAPVTRYFAASSDQQAQEKMDRQADKYY